MIPHLFSKCTIPPITNQELQTAIDEVNEAKSKEKAIEIAYRIITKHFRGYRFRTYVYFWKAFEADPNRLWERTGFMHCHHQNFLLRLLLIKSGWFQEADISLGFSLVGYVSPHQYLKIKIGEKTIAVDPWNAAYGAKIGEYASGFGFAKLNLLRSN